jgi:hypothetical protein
MTSSSDTNYGGLAATLTTKLNIESRIANAMGFTWLCAGIAILLTLSGLGLSCALLGYSYMTSSKPAADKIATALTQALQKADLKTTVSGKMALVAEPLKLASGQIIKLEPGSTVKLDPNSSVRAVGTLNMEIPQPSKRQLQVDATPQSKELPFTSYTIFKDVKMESGMVATGWNFDLADTTRPRYQYCYYTQDVMKGLRTKYVLAENGLPKEPDPLQKLPFKFEEALSNCIWFSGT